MSSYGVFGFRYAFESLRSSSLIGSRSSVSIRHDVPFRLIRPSIHPFDVIQRLRLVPFIELFRELCFKMVFVLPFVALLGAQ